MTLCRRSTAPTCYRERGGTDRTLGIPRGLSSYLTSHGYGGSDLAANYRALTLDDATTPTLLPAAADPPAGAHNPA